MPANDRPRRPEGPPEAPTVNTRVPRSDTDPDPFAATLPPDPARPPDANGVTSTLAGAAVPTTAEPPPPPPDIPGYHLMDELGRGGMGVVYKALQTRLHRTVALKMILAGEYAGPDARVRFLSEAEVIARLQHPNIVQLHEFNVHNGVPYFSLEFVDGGGLNEKLARQPLPPDEAAALVETLARAVHYAHQEGVVHRDLKPANVLLQTRPHDADTTPVSKSYSTHRSSHGGGSFGTLTCVLRSAAYIPKITDFGLAKSCTGSNDLTRSGAVMGTPSYMAPEQAGGRSKEVGPAADTYALGAILYEALTGRPPFQAATPLDTVLQVVHEEPVPPRRLLPKVPRDLETICLKCLQKLPGKRYATAAELADDLARYLTGEAIQARPVGPVERTWRWARRKPSAAALVAVLTLGTVGAAAAGWLTSAQLSSALADAQEQRKLADDRRREADDHAARAETMAAEATRQRDEANKQKAEADRQRDDADRQRKAVATGLQTRLDGLEAMLLNVDARLEKEGGLDSIRGEFLDDARKMSDKLLEENPDDPRVMRQAGRVYSAIGRLYSGRDSARAEQAYQTALKLEKQLHDLNPTDPAALVALSKTTYSRAYALWLGRKYKAADAALADAIALYDQRAACGDTVAEAATARYRYYRANVLEDLKKPQEAAALYRDALARQEKLAADPKADARLHSDRGNTAAGLAIITEAKNPDEAYALLTRAKAAHRAAAAADPDYQTAAKESLDDLYAFCQRHHRDADLAALAAEYADGDDRATGKYNAACYLGLAAKAAAEHPTLPPAEKAARAEKYGAAAVKMLREAVDVGFADRARVLQDSDLNALRGRADYQKFAAELTARFPGRPVTPADLVADLTGEFDGYLARYDGLRRRSQTAVDRARAKRSKPDFPPFAERVLALCAEHIATPAAVDGLVWVVGTAGDVTDPAAPAVRDKAIGLLGKCVGRPEFANAAKPLADAACPAGDALLRKALAAPGEKDAQGLAAFALAMSLNAQAEAETGAAQERLRREAEDTLVRVEKEFDGVPYKGGTLGPLAKKQLAALRGLAVGRPAREISGRTLDDQPIALSGYKGKVTLVMFWANWCGYCRQLFPATKEWASAYSGRPFAVVGVNTDADREEARKTAEREGLGWPSVWDGGPSGGKATAEWQIEAYPTLYLIDHTGVIRKKWRGMPGPEVIKREIDRLVPAAEASKK